MLPYQEQYIQNTREIAELSRFYSSHALSFDAWYDQQRQALERMNRLKKENAALLSAHLFPALDDLFSAPPEALAELSAFADQLMDWKTNLDCGVYVAIHDALLRMNRVRKDRNGVIRELYKLGMGLYYESRLVAGISDPRAEALYFQNEMVFTEAASYFRYFEEIDDEETRGYILRSMANIALCCKDHKRRIAISARILQIVQDPHFRALAPGLPWDVFLRRTHQQMSANRSDLSRGNLTRDELAAVLDSCYMVFKPEEGAEHPSIRWLWPYYEMEYSCGYVDLKTTLARLENLILSTSPEENDVSGLYGNVHLPLYYGKLMHDIPALQKDPDRVRFLDRAYRKLQDTLLSCPADKFDDYFFFLIEVVISQYFEMPGVLSYQALSTRLMQRFAGNLYIRSRRAGDMMRCLCAVLFDHDPAFFDDIPFLREISAPEEKKKALLSYAEGCGLYHAFGLLKMNIARTMQTRNLFEDEYQVYQLYTVSGAADLKKRASTAHFSDIALGHRSWYNGAGGYPAKYVRIDSPYRQMTDVAAVVACLLDLQEEDGQADIQLIQREAGRRFSPMVASCLSEEATAARLLQLLRSDEKAYYQTIYQELIVESDG